VVDSIGRTPVSLESKVFHTTGIGDHGEEQESDETGTVLLLSLITLVMFAILVGLSIFLLYKESRARAKVVQWNDAELELDRNDDLGSVRQQVDEESEVKKEPDLDSGREDMERMSAVQSGGEGMEEMSAVQSGRDMNEMVGSSAGVQIEIDVSIEGMRDPSHSGFLAEGK
jgi:preprotein translocase subunit SecG